MNVLDLELLANKVIGAKGYYLALLAMFIFSYGAQIAYMVIIGDCVPVVFRHLFDVAEVDRTVVILIVAVFIVLPLCLLRSISSLSYASFFSIAANLLLVLIVCIQGPITKRLDGITAANSHFSNASDSIFAGIGAMSFTFVCQHNSFMIYRSLREPSIGNWNKVVNYSISLALGICLVMGVAGYLAFYDRVQGDILKSFPVTGTLRTELYANPM